MNIFFSDHSLSREFNIGTEIFLEAMQLARICKIHNLKKTYIIMCYYNNILIMYYCNNILIMRYYK